MFTFATWPCCMQALFMDTKTLPNFVSRLRSMLQDETAASAAA